MGVDLGQARIGIALSDFNQILASPYSTINHQNDYESAFLEIVRIAERESVAEIVVGIPTSLSSNNSIARERTQEHIKRLRSLTSIKVSEFDERFTSVIALRKLRETGHNARSMKGKIDAIAAVQILQGYLDGQVH
jgi:putative Holliday junction resolvase